MKLLCITALVLVAGTASAMAQTASPGPSIDAGSYIHACQSSVDELTHKQLVSQALYMAAQDQLNTANAKIKQLEDAAKDKSSPAAPADKPAATK